MHAKQIVKKNKFAIFSISLLIITATSQVLFSEEIPKEKSVTVHEAVIKNSPRLGQLVNSGFSDLKGDETKKIVKERTGDYSSDLRREKRDKLLIVTSLDNIPFHFLDENGEPSGMLVDMWRLWGKKIGTEVDFTSAPWSESLEMVRDGRADIHAGCFFSVQRDKYLDFSNPLQVDCETHFFFHESILGLKNIEDLIGFKIGLLKQDYSVEFINRELPGAALVQYNSHRELFDGVTRGDVKVFICDTPVALYLLAEKRMLHKFRYHTSHPLYKSAFYAAVKEGNRELLARINRGLKEITPEERAAIERRWMGTPALNSESRLIITLPRNFPPFSMINANGKPSGMVVDMWQIWSEKSGVGIEFSMVDSSDGINELKDGMADILFTPLSDKKVREWSTFSRPFYNFEWHLYIADETISPDDFSELEPSINQALNRSENFNGLNERYELKRNPQGTQRSPDEHPSEIINAPSGKNLSQKTLITGALKGTIPFEALSSLSSDITMTGRIKFRLIGFDTVREMILAAEAGDINSFFGIPEEVSSYLNQLGISAHFRKITDQLTIKQPAVAVVRNFNPELIRKIDSGFDSFSEQEYLRIEKKWLGDRSAIRLDAIFIRRLVATVTPVLILIVITFFVRNRRRKIREKEMRIAKERAENENRAKSEFLAGLSHEIRTPLNAILGMTEITLHTDLDGQQERNLNVVKSSARHLLGIINDLLSISTIEAGRMKLRESIFNLDELLEQTVLTHRFSSEAVEKNLVIKLEKYTDNLGYYRGDNVKLEQILGNLMDNAVKFTDRGSVTLSAELLPHKLNGNGGKIDLVERTDAIVDLRFRVIDTGIGIPEDKQEIIFESFTQAESSTTRQYGGTGLGLAICKASTKLMSGRLELQSTPDSGTIFTLTLPMIREVVAENSSLTVSNSKHNETNSLRILLVEDCNVNAEVAREYFTMLGHKVNAAKNGNEALKILGSERFDMIFMDIEMPGMDGLSVTRSIRNGKIGSNNTEIPIIAMTAHAIEEYRLKSLSAGMDDFLPKPVEISDLEEIIERNRNPRRKSNIKSAEPAGRDDELPLLDENEGLRLFARNRELLIKIYGIFISETPPLIADLKRAIESDDRGKIGISAHTLKGAAARICATSSKSMFLELETAAKNNVSEEEIRKLAGRAIAEMEKVIVLLKKISQEYQPV